jgi:hypothetical protein
MIGQRDAIESLGKNGISSVRDAELTNQNRRMVWAAIKLTF